jgi:hypothetical protein
MVYASTIKEDHIAQNAMGLNFANITKENLDVKNVNHVLMIKLKNRV